MKVALPIFGIRVSPRFDCAPRLLWFTVQDGAVMERGEISLSLLTPWQRIERIKELGVDVLICGAIDENSAQMLTLNQIHLVPWVAGEVEEALDFFLRGKLRPGIIFCPRCRGRRHHSKIKFPQGLRRTFKGG